MATDFTPNYNLDKYTATDKPNLRDQYNAAMDKIDLALLSANTNATDAKNTAQRAETDVSTKASQSDLNSLASILPSTDFDSVNTVAAALNARQDRNVIYYGAKRNSNNDWATIFAASIADIGGIIFPAGTWNIDSSINITDCKFFVGNGTRLNFASTNSALHFNVTVFNIRPTLVSGFKFEGNGIANIALQQDTANTLFVTNCTFTNFLHYFIYTEFLGLYVSDCYFYGVQANTTSISLCGVKCTTDSFILNSKFFHCRVSISCRAACVISNCYIFTAPVANGWESYGIGNFSISGNTVTVDCMSDVVISNCEIDTVTYAFSACEMSRITDCIFMWDPNASSNNAIFVIDDATTVAYIAYKTLFNQNTINVNGISAGKTLHTFKALGSTKKPWVFTYVSKDCCIIGNSTNVYLAIGCLHSSTYTHPSTEHCKLISQCYGNNAPLVSKMHIEGTPLIITPIFVENSKFLRSISATINTTRPIGYHPQANVGNIGADLYLYQSSIDYYGEYRITGHPYEAHIGVTYNSIPSNYEQHDSVALSVL